MVQDVYAPSYAPGLASGSAWRDVHASTLVSVGTLPVTIVVALPHAILFLYHAAVSLYNDCASEYEEKLIELYNPWKWHVLSVVAGLWVVSYLAITSTLIVTDLLACIAIEMLLCLCASCHEYFIHREVLRYRCEEKCIKKCKTQNVKHIHECVPLDDIVTVHCYAYNALPYLFAMAVPFISIGINSTYLGKWVTGLTAAIVSFATVAFAALARLRLNAPCSKKVFIQNEAYWGVVVLVVSVVSTFVVNTQVSNYGS